MELAEQERECLVVYVSKPELPQEFTQISELMTELCSFKPRIFSRSLVGNFTTAWSFLNITVFALCENLH